jgi:hypothetical protein
MYCSYASIIIVDQSSLSELRDNLEHLRQTQVNNKGASTTLVKNNIASFMEAVDIMKGWHSISYLMMCLDCCLADIRRLSADDRKKNVYEPVICLIEG